MLPTYIRAYKDAVKGILALDTETAGDPDAQSALASVASVYARAVNESTVPDLDLAKSYADVLEYHLEEALNRIQELEPDPEEDPEPESEPAPTVSKMETVHPTAADIAVDVAKLEAEPPSVLVCTGPLGVREDDPEPSKPRKRIDHILEYVREHPGLTKAEIAEGIGCPHTGVYYPITKLVQQGHLRAEIDPSDGRFRYYPAEGAE